MGFFRKLLSRWRRKKNTEELKAREEEKSFFLYIMHSPQVLTYFRRAKGIPKKKLELVLVDHEEQPAYQVAQIVELLMKDLNLLYIVTERKSEFEELAEEAMEQSGLLIVLLEPGFGDEMPGNLLLDLRDWEKHLDIASGVSYNTLHYEV